MKYQQKPSSKINYQITTVLFPAVVFLGFFGDPVAAYAFEAIEQNSSSDVNFDTYPEKLPREAARRPSQSRKKAAPDPISYQVVPASELSAAPIEPIPQASGAIQGLQVAVLPSVEQQIAFEFGVSVQAYQPSGKISLQGVQPYSIGDVGTQPMVALDLAWMPMQFETDWPTSMGFFASMGYAQHKVSLNDVNGASVSNTVLQSLKTEGGLVASIQPGLESKYRLKLQGGAGHWNQIQSSDALFANQSAYEIFATLGAVGEVRFTRQFAVYLAYEYRSPLQSEPEEIHLQRDNLQAGISGSFE